ARHLAAAAAGAVRVTALDDPIFDAVERLAVVEPRAGLRDEIGDRLRRLVRTERDREAPASLQLDGRGLLIARDAPPSTCPFRPYLMPRCPRIKRPAECGICSPRRRPASTGSSTSSWRAPGVTGTRGSSRRSPRIAMSSCGPPGSRA